MTHTYQVTGMTCSGCEAKVKSQLLSTPGVISAEVSKDTATAIITMEKHIPLATFQTALGGSESKYQIAATQHTEAVEQAKSWWETYKPVLLIFVFITAVTLLVQIGQPFNGMLWMQHFMAGFFLVFSFFKLLNLKGFATSYAMYDILAKRLPAWGYVYAFIELGLGIAYLTNFEPFVTNIITLGVMTISIIGVLQSVLNKRAIQCACLGAIFNLPMSTITIVEDTLMIGMSAGMLIWMM
jgi:copper chaperone CopZ